MPPFTLADPDHEAWLEAETLRLVDFARASRVADGFAWLDRDGRPEDRPQELWLVCRMTHVFALADLRGDASAAAYVDHGLEALWGRFRDAEHGGWWTAVTSDGPVSSVKEAYGHAFVVLAASSATAAGRAGARALLDVALEVLDRFWDDDHRMLVDEWDAAFTTPDPYRGINANMHGVEALLAAYDVTGDAVLLDRASAITTRALDAARANGWRLPEHYDEAWRPLPDYNRDEPAHPFRPYGGTVGHWFEWARLTVQLHATAGGPDSLVQDAAALFARGVEDGWAVDGAEGFVYTVDWDGRPVVRQRMHWVVGEAIAAAAALARATGDPSYAEHYARWWAHVDAHVVDREHGSWWHELGPDLTPGSGTWGGKPDAYHAVQACLLPRLPAAPSLATALARAAGRRADAASVVVAASAAATFRALVDPAAIVDWLPPEGMTGRFEHADIREHGSYRLVLTRTDGGTGKTTDDSDVVDVRIGEVTPGHRIVQQADFVSDDPAFAGTMTMTWSVLPHPGGCRVEVTATGVPSGIDHAVHEQALASTLTNLAAWL